MIPLAFAFVLLGLICWPFILLAFRGILMSRDPTPERRRKFRVALLNGPLLVVTWIAANWIARAGWMPRPPMPDPESGEAVMCAAISIVMAYTCANMIVSALSKARSHGPKFDPYMHLEKNRSPSHLDKPKNKKKA